MISRISAVNTACLCNRSTVLHQDWRIEHSGWLACTTHSSWTMEPRNFTCVHKQARLSLRMLACLTIFARMTWIGIRLWDVGPMKSGYIVQQLYSVSTGGVCRYMVLTILVDTFSVRKAICQRALECRLSVKKLYEWRKKSLNSGGGCNIHRPWTFSFQL